MCSKIILLPAVPTISPLYEPFAGGKIDCSLVDEADTKDQSTRPTQEERIPSKEGDESRVNVQSQVHRQATVFERADDNQVGLITAEGPAGVFSQAQG